MSTIDRNLLEQAFGDAGLGMSNAELHGLLCGFACAPGDVALPVQGWLATLDNEGDVTTVPLEVWLGIINALAAEIDAADFAFQPLIPDDNEPLTDRVSALADWAQGYIAAIGLAALADPVMQDDQGSEFLETLSALARVQEQDADSDDDAEADFMEVSEYLRMGTIYLRELLKTADLEGANANA